MELISNSKTKPFYYLFNFFNFFFFLLIAPVSFAQQNTQTPGVTSVSAETMLVNIGQQIPSLMRLVTAVAYLIGMYLVIKGIMKLKHVGESRTMMSQEHGMLGPLVTIGVGALLLYLPSAVQVGMSTFWTDPNPYGYMEQTDEWGEFLNVCYLIIQFVGTIAFIRGLVILSQVGSSHGGQQGGFGKGLTHIIGGIFCINIYQFVQVIMSTLGLSWS